MSEKAPYPRLGVYHPEPYVWLAPSKSRPGSYWKVEVHHTPTAGYSWTCTCPAGDKRGAMGPKLAPPCRHVLLVAKAEEADGLAERPVAPIADGGVFID